MEKKTFKDRPEEGGNNTDCYPRKRVFNQETSKFLKEWVVGHFEDSPIILNVLGRDKNRREVILSSYLSARVVVHLVTTWWIGICGAFV